MNGGMWTQNRTRQMISQEVRPSKILLPRIDGIAALYFFTFLLVSGLTALTTEVTELRKPFFCGLTQPTKPLNLPDPKQYDTWNELIDATCNAKLKLSFAI